MYDIFIIVLELFLKETFAKVLFDHQQDGVRAAGDLIKAGMDPRISPCEDFYTFSCGKLKGLKYFYQSTVANKINLSQN